jgi:hypothetical protein
MKSLMPVLIAAFFVSACVFEAPFAPEAKLPVDGRLLGRWEEVKSEEVKSNKKLAAERMLVLQHSDHEYLVEYPVGEKAMFFRAYAVELADERHLQIQLIGTAAGAVKPQDRKYHLVKMALTKDALEIRTIKPEVLGKDLRDTEALKAAFDAHKDDAGLFGDPVMFRRLQ